MELGKTIKSLRRERDMTQDEMAEALMVSPAAVSQWECGKMYLRVCEQSQNKSV